MLFYKLGIIISVMFIIISFFWGTISLHHYFNAEDRLRYYSDLTFGTFLLIVSITLIFNLLLKLYINHWGNLLMTITIVAILFCIVSLFICINNYRKSYDPTITFIMINVVFIIILLIQLYTLNHYDKYLIDYIR